MSDHYTLRFPAGTTSRLERRARQAGAAPRTLAQRYVEEGLRHDEHPLVHFLDGPSGRRAAIVGTGLDVWEIVATVRENDNDQEQAAAHLGVPLGLIQAAIAYYADYRGEIDEQIALNEAEWERGYSASQRGEQALHNT